MHRYMKQIIALKLQATPEQGQSLKATMRAFNAACNYLADVAHAVGTVNKLKLQQLAYYDVRGKFGLSAQLTVRAIAKTCEAYKRDKSIKPQFREFGAVPYDERILSYKGIDRVSITVLDGRVVVPMQFGAYQSARLDRVKGQADLVLRNGVFYLYATIDLPEPPVNTPDEFLGIDLGIVNIATDSDGDIHSGKVLKAVRYRHRRLRTKLQKKGTKSARRLLKQLGGTEQRFAKDVNHCLSKRIVAKAKDTKRGLAVEALGGIRERIRLRKAQRVTLHNWSFGQLQAFLSYKARMAGVLLVAVDPRNTSRTCPACGHVDKKNRPSQSQFRCASCGLAGHADCFAAVNIAVRGRASVMVPHVSSLPA